MLRATVQTALRPLLAAALAAGCAAAPPAARQEPPPAAPRAPGPDACERIVRLEVDKSERLLRAHCAGGAIVDVHAALGREPLGPKRERGDRRTPEGRYRVSGPPRTSRFHRFVPIDYPSAADAEAALADARISPDEHARIVRAHERGEAPPGDTPLGGGLGIHGEGARWSGDSPYLDWTYGCVAVDDAWIEFIAERVEVGTPVDIRP